MSELTVRGVRRQMGDLWSQRYHNDNIPYRLRRENPPFRAALNTAKDQVEKAANPGRVSPAEADRLLTAAHEAVQHAFQIIDDAIWRWALQITTNVHKPEMAKLKTAAGFDLTVRFWPDLREPWQRLESGWMRAYNFDGKALAFMHLVQANWDDLKACQKAIMQAQSLHVVMAVPEGAPPTATFSTNGDGGVPIADVYAAVVANDQAAFTALAEGHQVEGAWEAARALFAEPDLQATAEAELAEAVTQAAATNGWKVGLQKKGKGKKGGRK